MESRFEGFFRGQDASELFYQSWSVKEPKGTFLITHGIAEHSERYAHFGEQLNKDNWNVVAWDLRGHGRSEGKRGYVKEFSNYIKDLDILARLVQKELHPEGKPMVLFGHSMGGLITTSWSLSSKDFLPAAICLSSPAMGLNVKVAKSKEILAKVAAKIAPTITMWNEIKYEDIIQDEELMKAYDKDPLRHDKISPAVFLGMLEYMDFVAHHASEFKPKLLMQISGIDKVVSPQSASSFFDQVNSEGKEIYVYNDSYHEIFNDIHQDKPFKDLRRFLQQL